MTNSKWPLLLLVMQGVVRGRKEHVSSKRVTFTQLQLTCQTSGPVIPAIAGFLEIQKAQSFCEVSWFSNVSFKLCGPNRAQL